MKFSKSTYLSLACLAVLSTLFGCKSYYTPLSIQYPQKSKQELSSDIQSLTLMNRSIDNRFINFREDSLQKYFYRKGFQLSTILRDSTAADTTIRALAALLYESGRYDVVVPLERNLPRDTTDLIPEQLDPIFVDDICRNFDTDGLLVMEYFSTKIMADYSKEKYLTDELKLENYYYASIDIGYQALFRIYKAGANIPVKELVLVDTIYWDAADYTQQKLFRELPTVKQAMINSAIKIALDLDQKLSPIWVKVRRGYFLFSLKNDKGKLLMDENRYEEAAEFWNEQLQSTNKKIRSKAEFNMALISELNGDIETAIDWAVKSFFTYYRSQTEAYISNLKKRQEIIKKENS